jgi:hypothetical protein
LEAKVRAHHAHLGVALQSLKISLQREFRPAQGHVIDLVISQITQRSGITPAPGEEVLVDPQHLWAASIMPLPPLALESALKVALDGGRDHPFSSPQRAAIDAVQVLSKDHLWKRFSGSLAGMNPWKPFAEVR